MNKTFNKIKSTSYTHIIQNILYKIHLKISFKNTFQHIHSTNSNNR